MSHLHRAHYVCPLSHLWIQAFLDHDIFLAWIPVQPSLLVSFHVNFDAFLSYALFPCNKTEPGHFLVKETCLQNPAFFQLGFFFFKFS